MAHWFHCPHCAYKRDLTLTDREFKLIYEYRDIWIGDYPATSRFNELGAEGWRFTGCVVGGYAIFMREGGHVG